MAAVERRARARTPAAVATAIWWLPQVGARDASIYSLVWRR